ncbi:TetR/AcrR family transcriptional regulator [Pedobacter zeae]|uniref:Transcriptional regulator n=1 Tax=Pedobacter zeae TaxID=1737356 RepID=A0A7W6P4P2_9SPHI|nr:TetR family transcriptional regulator [Pedobacter zeae]MBB4106928.1 AcrR family transcriptional regulator [Pedobacter zeae]GGH04651.1 transcriptional regulator [Pedobacter zeae]
MARKVTDGPVRNKERTKSNLISALGKILKKDGFSGLNITRVAEVAKVDRRLIYDYFGGLDGLVNEYLSRNDYWKINTDDIGRIVEASKADAGKKLTYRVLEDQFDSLINNEEMRRIITWGLSEKLPILKELDLKRETIGDQILSEVVDGYFKNTDKNFRAIYALLMGGVYYLTLYAKMQENPFCGIDIQQPAGEQAIKDALKQILDITYG